MQDYLQDYGLAIDIIRDPSSFETRIEKLERNAFFSEYRKKQVGEDTSVQNVDRFPIKRDAVLRNNVPHPGISLSPAFQSNLNIMKKFIISSMDSNPIF